MSRMSEMAAVATFDALAQAGLKADCSLHSPRVLLAMGSTTGSPFVMEAYYKKLFERGGPEGQPGTSFFKGMNHSVAANVAAALGFIGPVIAPCSACSTSSQAAVLGWELIRAGLYDVVIVGGADELHYTSVAVFDNVMATSVGYNDRPELSPRPFDKNRDGLVVGEGAGVLVLESLSHAKNRDAKILAEFNGGAYLCDGTHMSQPQAPSMAQTMELALERSKISADKVDYVNAHATATVLGDPQETLATSQVFGSNILVSSLKGHLGHTLAACGAIELLASIEMIRQEILIPTLHLEEVDPSCSQVQHVGTVRGSKVNTILSNNFAFGGMNTACVVSKFL
jgi:3-oxoacyl-[acyl-carrier-protein] synthase II